MVGLDMVGADTGGFVSVAGEYVGAAVDQLKKAGAALIPAAASAATDALADKPADGSAPGGKGKGGGKGGKDVSASSGDSFLSTVIVEPVKVWHALLGVVAAGGGYYLWKRK